MVRPCWLYQIRDISVLIENIILTIMITWGGEKQYVYTHDAVVQKMVKRCCYCIVLGIDKDLQGKERFLRLLFWVFLYIKDTFGGEIFM